VKSSPLCQKIGDLEPYYERDIQDQPIICSHRVDDEILSKKWKLDNKLLSYKD